MEKIDSDVVDFCKDANFIKNLESNSFTSNTNEENLEKYFDYYDDNGNVIFTLVTADLIRNYYYLVPGNFTSYDGLQLYQMVEQENK